MADLALDVPVPEGPETPTVRRSSRNIGNGATAADAAVVFTDDMPRRRPATASLASDGDLSMRREACGLRQADVAIATGRSRPVVSRWEAVEIEPDFADLAILAALLSTPRNAAGHS